MMGFSLAAVLVAVTSAVLPTPDASLPQKGLCGHQGDLAAEPSNTPRGLLAAVAKGAVMVEFDVQRCATGEFICRHDGDLATTTTVTGKTWQSSFAHIRSAKIRRGKKIYDDLTVPTFDEMIDCLPRTGVWANVHCYGSAHIARDIALKLKEKGRLGQAFVSASLAQLKEAKAAVPELMTCNMTRPGKPRVPWTDEQNAEYLRKTIENGCQFLQLRRPWPKAFSDKAHAAGIRVNFCPCDEWGNDPAKLKEVFDGMGVDFLLTENVEVQTRAYKALSSGAAVPPAADAPRMPDEIRLEGDYAGHLQDVWFDGAGHLYWAHTRELVKTDLAGHIQKRVPVDGHHAGIEVRNGRVYVAVCAMQNTTGGKTTSGCRVTVGEYDAETLDLVAMHVTDIHDRSGSLTIRDDGTFLVGCLRPQDVRPDQVRFHHLDRDFKLIRSYVLDNVPVRLGIEVIKREGDGYRLFVYGVDKDQKPLDFDSILLDRDFREVSRAKFGGACGFVRMNGERWIGKSTRDKASKRYTSRLIRVR